MAGCCSCAAVVCNSCRKNGTTAFERIFMSQEPSAKDSILVVAELLVGESDFTLEEVEGNVLHAVQEHDRLRQILTKAGLWIEVDIDVKANHLRWVDEVQDAARQFEGGVDEDPGLLEALRSMPAFEDKTGRTPRWQVIATPRKLVMHIHHAAVDGVSLAIIAATLFTGASLAETANTLSQLSTRRQNTMGCWERVCSACETVSSFFQHATTPATGRFAPMKQTAISDPSGCAEIANIRYIHLGPYPLQRLKSFAKSRNEPLNSTLMAAAAAGLRDYCAACGDESTPLVVAVPVNFKVPKPDKPESMQANNDFSTMVIDLGSVEGNGEDKLPLIDSSAWTLGRAYGALAAQESLSLLPMSIVRWIVHNSSRTFNFIFSNVNGSVLGRDFVSKATGARKKFRGYAYGAANGTCRIFILTNTHGDDLHFGVTVDETVISDRRKLGECLNRRLLSACA